MSSIPPARRIRVLHVLPWLHTGGVERRRMQLVRWLDPARYEHRIVCLYAKEMAYLRGIREAGVEVVVLGRGTGTFFDVRSIARIAREARRFRPDIIHGAVFEGVTLAAIAGTLARVPRVLVEDTGDPSIRSWRGDLVMGSVTRLADAVIGVSPPVTRYLEGRLRLPSAKVNLVMNGVERPRVPPAEELAQARAGLGIDPADFVIGSAGRMDDGQKRFTDLVTAFAPLVADHPRLRLLLVGSGRDQDKVRRHAEALGVAARVTFAGYQPDMGLMYHLMDVFALASKHESFGLVNAEAMLCGLPVVATRVGGVPHVVQDEVTGLLVPTGKPSQLSAALRRVVEDADLRRRLGEAGRARAEEHFTVDRYVRDVSRVYEHLMASG